MLNSDFTKDSQKDKIRKKQTEDAIPFPEPGPPPDLEFGESETSDSSSEKSDEIPMPVPSDPPEIKSTILPHTAYTAENKYDKKGPDYSAAYSQKQRRYREAICERYNANVELERAYFSEKKADGDSDGHINGQALGKLGMMSFGPTIEEAISSPKIQNRVKTINNFASPHAPFGTAGNSDCEAVAIYNTLYDLGSEISLSQVIYDIEFSNFTLWHGWFGTKITRMDNMLKAYGISCYDVKYSQIPQIAAENGRLDNGQIFIASVLNNPARTGIHTFEIVYTPLSDSTPQWTVYNRFSNISTCMTYGTFEEILQHKAEDSDDIVSDKYIVIYKIDMEQAKQNAS